jgi:tripartite-type tricarboxylate transporter receptor subunit TctC
VLCNVVGPHWLLPVSGLRDHQAKIIDTLNREINAGLADPTMQARIADLGRSAMPMTPTDFGKFIADETEKWRKVIQVANIKAE